MTYPACGGDDCQRGFCRCESELEMWADERASPWLLWLYAAVAVLAIAGSMLWPWGFA